MVDRECRWRGSGPESDVFSVWCEDSWIIRSIGFVTSDRGTFCNSVQFCQNGSSPISQAIQPWLGHSKAHSMTTQEHTSKATTGIALSLAICFCMFASTGCQVSLNGQTLPSPYYLQDDVQYFPSGPEFKLPREAAALKAARAEEKANRR